MYLRLNEQEVIDSICVFAANEFCCAPEDINVKEIKALDDGDIQAHAHVSGRMFSGRNFNLEDICTGIYMFLGEYHSFDETNLTVMGVNHDVQSGFWAEVTVNE